MTLPPDIANALIVAQNALAGYVQLSNGSDTEEHHQTALHASATVREAIRAHGVLEQTENPIQPGDLVRMTDAYRRAIHATGGFRNGEVLDVRDDTADVDWLDETLPRQVELAVLEKVERGKRPEPSAQRGAGFALGDTVRYKPDFLRNTGQVASETARLRGTILALKPIGTNAKVTVEWSNGRTHAVLTSNLARAEVRGRG